MDVLRPPLSLLVKLGSIAVHVDEMLSPGGHEYDVKVLQNLLRDPEVEEWIAEASKHAWLPVKRTR